MEPTNDILSGNEVLRGIALQVLNENGVFLRAYAELYLNANEENREIMKPAWQQFIEKYLFKNHGVAQEEADV